MLPLLPALLLLILQGPSSLEKMASDGRLPAALEAIHQQMESREPGSTSLSEADEAVLASLLALSSDPHVSHALLQLLSLDSCCVPVETGRPIGLDWNLDDPPLPIEGRWIAALADGFAHSQRSRDGPEPLA